MLGIAKRKGKLHFLKVYSTANSSKAILRLRLTFKKRIGELGFASIACKGTRNKDEGLPICLLIHPHSNTAKSHQSDLMEPQVKLVLTLPVLECLYYDS